MAEVTGVGGRTQPPDSSAQTTGRAGVTGQPAHEVPSGASAPPGSAAAGKVIPDALIGLDKSQAAAAEQLRATGGVSAIEALLGLDREPPILGAFPAPRGNTEALRQLTPMERRKIMHDLLKKQEARLGRLITILNLEGRSDEREADSQGGGSFAGDSVEGEMEAALLGLNEAQLLRARREVAHATRMLRLLSELLAMQDYALSQVRKLSHP